MVEKEYNKNKFYFRLLFYLLSLIILSLSTSMFIHVNLIGIAPIDIFFQDISKLLKVKIGIVILVINIIFWLFQYVVYKFKELSQINIYFYLQLIPTLLFGFLVDFWNTFLQISIQNSFWPNFLLFIMSFTIMCLGIAMMLVADIIRNPYAGMNFAIITLFNYKYSFKKIRVINDFLWVVFSLPLILIYKISISNLNIGTILFITISGPLSSYLSIKMERYLKFNSFYKNNL